MTHDTPTSIKRKPVWLRVKAPTSHNCGDVRKLLRDKNLTTVCEEAACPNIGECWTNRTATFMILGEDCTRGCRFCNVKTAKNPALPDKNEPAHVADAVASMALKHAVITSVTRDDLPDGGAKHFCKTIKAVRERSPDTTIEVLIPDFREKKDALKDVVDAAPDVLNHNLETIRRLYPTVRPQADYFHSLDILKEGKAHSPDIFTKSGIMVGLGETEDEVLTVMDDLRASNVDFLTIGQYLQPTKKHLPITEYVTPDQFKRYEKAAYDKGFLLVSASPLTRSSHHAGKDFAKLKAKRAAGQQEGGPFA